MGHVLTLTFLCPHMCRIFGAAGYRAELGEVSPWQRHVTSVDLFPHWSLSWGHCYCVGVVKMK